MAENATSVYAGGTPPADTTKPGYMPAPYQCSICSAWYDLRDAKNRATNFCNACQDEAIARIKEPTEAELAAQAEKRKAHFGELRTMKSRADLLNG